MISPDSIFVKDRKAQILLKQQDVRNCLVELAILRDLGPDRADVHLLLGWSYAMNSEKDLALQNFMVALALDPLISQPISTFSVSPTISHFGRQLYSTNYLFQAGSMIRNQINALERDDSDDVHTA